MKKEPKHYTLDEIRAFYIKLTYKKQVEILFEALGHMQQYNNRSKAYCIALGMGYKNDVGLNDTFFK